MVGGPLPGAKGDILFNYFLTEKRDLRLNNIVGRGQKTRTPPFFNLLFAHGAGGQAFCQRTLRQVARLLNVPMRIYHKLSHFYGLRHEFVGCKDFPGRLGNEMIPGIVWLPRRGKYC